MNADELRRQLAELLREEFEDAEVRVQGKRIVVEDEDDITIILVTAASRERLLRELRDLRKTARAG